MSQMFLSNSCLACCKIVFVFMFMLMFVTALLLRLDLTLGDELVCCRPPVGPVCASTTGSRSQIFGISPQRYFWDLVTPLVPQFSETQKGVSLICFQWQLRFFANNRFNWFQCFPLCLLSMVFH